ncbi:MAG: UPF0158 family protein [archaeon]
MKLNIGFDEIMTAFEFASNEMHYFIDIKNNAIIHISSRGAGSDLELEKMKNDSDNFIPIPVRNPKEDIGDILLFESGLPPPKSKTLVSILFGPKPLNRFRELISKDSKLMEKWYAHREKELKNNAMDFLCIKDIELSNKGFMPEIEIRKIDADKIEMPDGFDGFGPARCLNCNTRKNIVKRFFEVNIPSENMLIEKEIERIMKKKYGIENYGHLCGGKKEILTAARCSKCKSDEIYWDF